MLFKMHIWCHDDDKMCITVSIWSCYIGLCSVYWSTFALDCIRPPRARFLPSVAVLIIMLEVKEDAWIFNKRRAISCINAWTRCRGLGKHGWGIISNTVNPVHLYTPYFKVSLCCTFPPPHISFSLSLWLQRQMRCWRTVAASLLAARQAFYTRCHASYSRVLSCYPTAHIVGLVWFSVNNHRQHNEEVFSPPLRCERTFCFSPTRPQAQSGLCCFTCLPYPLPHTGSPPLLHFTSWKCPVLLGGTVVSDVIHSPPHNWFCN